MIYSKEQRITEMPFFLLFAPIHIKLNLGKLVKKVWAHHLENFNAKKDVINYINVMGYESISLLSYKNQCKYV